MPTVQSKQTPGSTEKPSARASLLQIKFSSIGLHLRGGQKVNILDKTADWLKGLSLSEPLTYLLIGEFGDVAKYRNRTTSEKRQRKLNESIKKLKVAGGFDRFSGASGVQLGLGVAVFYNKDSVLLEHQSLHITAKTPRTIHHILVDYALLYNKRQKTLVLLVYVNQKKSSAEKTKFCPNQCAEKHEEVRCQSVEEGRLEGLKKFLYGKINEYSLQYEIKGKVIGGDINVHYEEDLNRTKFKSSFGKAGYRQSVAHPTNIMKGNLIGKDRQKFVDCVDKKKLMADFKRLSRNLMSTDWSINDQQFMIQKYIGLKIEEFLNKKRRRKVPHEEFWEKLVTKIFKRFELATVQENEQEKEHLCILVKVLLNCAPLDTLPDPDADDDDAWEKSMRNVPNELMKMKQITDAVRANNTQAGIIDWFVHDEKIKVNKMVIYKPFDTSDSHCPVLTTFQQA